MRSTSSENKTGVFDGDSCDRRITPNVRLCSRISKKMRQGFRVILHVHKKMNRSVRSMAIEKSQRIVLCIRLAIDPR